MISIIKDPLGKDRAFEVTSTGPLPEKPTLERAACEVAHILGDPGAGITYLDVLTLPEEVQDIMEFHAEEITAEEEYIDGKITFSDKVETHYRTEFLVKPLQVQEQEVAAFIMGYTRAMYNQRDTQFAKDCYWMTGIRAQILAHQYLSGKYEFSELIDFIEKKLDSSNEFQSL